MVEEWSEISVNALTKDTVAGKILLLQPRIPYGYHFDVQTKEDE